MSVLARVTSVVAIPEEAILRRAMIGSHPANEKREIIQPINVRKRKKKIRIMRANQFFMFPERRRQITWCDVAIGRYFYPEFHSGTSRSADNFTLNFIQALISFIVPCL
jgi:hypothetical protein